MARNTMLIHVLDDNLKEIGKPVRTKTHAQEVSYKKRMWPLNHISDDVKITDSKGIIHSFVHANESDGTFHFITPMRMNLFDFESVEEKIKVKPIDMCAKCGDRISIDARNVRDLLKRKTIDTFWGLDSSHILLLIIMGIVTVGLLGFAFYEFGQTQTLQKQLNAYLPAPETVKKTSYHDTIGEIISYV